ncbi:hypothetical protein D3C76_914640 [compost metagenome]
MAFQLHHHRLLPSPSAQCATERRQQDVIDLRAIGSRCLLQELRRLLRRQPEMTHRLLAGVIAATRVVAGQLPGGRTNLIKPPVSLLRFDRCCLGLQALDP